LGVVLMNVGGHHGEESATEGHHFHWMNRVAANLWATNVYFTGLAIIGVFFVAIQYAAQAGWSAIIIRIPGAFGYWLPIAGVLMLALFFVFGHDLFHWTHESLYVKGGEEFDKIIHGKRAFFFWPMHEHPHFPYFFIFRMVLFFGLWYYLFQLIRKKSLEEDLHGGHDYWFRMVKYSAIFLVIFAISSSVAAWDWILSIDTHWFSTMIGWYVFASWFVAGLAAITLVVVFLRDNGYLQMVTQDHLHDMGKFVFAFSIFWAYIWLGQYLLIYYANIPEETIYFVERLMSDHYRPYFYINLLFNFFLPFLILMTRDSKRHSIFLKIVCSIVLFGHWIDFYLMVMPGTIGENSGFGFIEIGILLIYASAFLFVVFTNLAKVPLVAKNHPMLEESLHHHI